MPQEVELDQLVVRAAHGARLVDAAGEARERILEIFGERPPLLRGEERVELAGLGRRKIRLLDLEADRHVEDELCPRDIDRLFATLRNEYAPILQMDPGRA